RRRRRHPLVRLPPRPDLGPRDAGRHRRRLTTHLPGAPREVRRASPYPEVPVTALVYFSSVSGNTHRFVEKLGLPARRIPLLRTDEPLRVTEPYVLVAPT